MEAKTTKTVVPMRSGRKKEALSIIEPERGVQSIELVAIPN